MAENYDGQSEGHRSVWGKAYKMHSVLLQMCVSAIG